MIPFAYKTSLAVARECIVGTQTGKQGAPVEGLCIPGESVA